MMLTNTHRTAKASRSPARVPRHRTSPNAPGTDLSSLIQTKLRVGAPNDKYEQEADRIADQVMRMPEPAIDGTPVHDATSGRPEIQCKCAPCESGAGLCSKCAEEETLQRQPVEEEEEEMLQTKSTGDADCEVTAALDARIGAMRGCGRLLPEDSRRFFEPRYNAGDVLDNEASKKTSTDASGRPTPDPDKIGLVQAKGEIKYYSVATTGDLGDVGKSPSTPNGGWSPTADNRTNKLSGTLTEPTWWKTTPLEGPETRIAGVQWKCCGGTDDYNYPFAVP